MDKDRTIELRSEKASKVIGYIPSILVRWGIVIITVILFLLLVAAYFIPYPENAVGIVTVEDVEGAKCCVSVAVPYKYVAQVKDNMPLKVELEGYDARSFGYLSGKISAIDKTVISLAGKSYFNVTAHLDFSKIDVSKQMKGDAYILLSDKSILSNFIDTIVK